MPSAPTTPILPPAPTHNIKFTPKQRTIANMVLKAQQIQSIQTPHERALLNARKANENRRILHSKTNCKQNEKCTISGGKK